MTPPADAAEPSGPTGAVLAIDQGSQSTKVSIVDTDGRVLAHASAPLRPLHLADGGVAEHPDDDLWDSLLIATRAALADHDRGGVDIAAVGLCTIRCCRALLGADGSLAAPVRSWMDARVWRPHLPEAGVARVTSAGGYLTGRLTGTYRDSIATCAEWPLDLDVWDWDISALPAQGLAEVELAELVLPGEILGPLSGEAAVALGLGAGTPVVATANDKAVEALGAGLVEEDEVLVSLGTYITAMTPAAAAAPPADGRAWTNLAATPHGLLIEGGGIRRGMWTVTWLSELLGRSVEDLGAVAAPVPPGSHGLLTTLDWLAPTDDPHRRGSIIGFDGRHGPGELFRSVLEGIALTMREHVDGLAAALGRDFATVTLTGGGARSELLAQIFADVFDRPVRRPVPTGTAGLGAAMCAAAGVGLHRDVVTAQRAMAPAHETFGPEPAAARAYAELRTAYREVATALDPINRRIHALTPHERHP